jgi:hypothetical protein
MRGVGYQDTRFKIPDTGITGFLLPATGILYTVSLTSGINIGLD